MSRDKEASGNENRNINIGQGNYNENIEGDVVEGNKTTYILPKAEIAPPNNLPHSGVSEFVGRDEELVNLHQQLQENERVAISAITGMGGVGKTELALQYASRYWEEEYQGGVCWLRVREKDLAIEIIQFFQAKINPNISEQLKEVKEVEQKVRYCWNSWQPSELDKEALIILDDVTDYQVIEPYLPPNNSKFKTLITTRKRLGSPIKIIELDILTPEAALELLISLVGAERVNREREIAEEICEWLGYLPLGIELVGKFLERKTTWNFGKVKAKFAEEGLNAKAVQKDKKIITTAKRGVAAAFELSWSELTLAAQELACYLSIFALAPISLDLIKAYEVEEKSDDIEELIDDYLVNFSLLKYDEKNKTYSLHQLIREYLQTKLKQVPQVEEMKQKICQQMIEISKSIPATPTQEDLRRVAFA